MAVPAASAALPVATHMLHSALRQLLLYCRLLELLDTVGTPQTSAAAAELESVPKAHAPGCLCQLPMQEMSGLEQMKAYRRFRVEGMNSTSGRRTCYGAVERGEPLHAMTCCYGSTDLLLPRAPQHGADSGLQRFAARVLRKRRQPLCESIGAVDARLVAARRLQHQQQLNAALPLAAFAEHGQHVPLDVCLHQVQARSLTAEQNATVCRVMLYCCTRR